MSNEPPQLPGKYSELIRLAIADLEKCENDPLYRIDMYFYHQPHFNHCYVCLAGAVMAKTLGAKVDKTCLPSYFTYRQKVMLENLDLLRDGIFHGLPEKEAEVLNEHPAPADYKIKPEQFKADMLAISDKLEAAGL